MRQVNPPRRFDRRRPGNTCPALASSPSTWTIARNVGSVMGLPPTSGKVDGNRLHRHVIPVIIPHDALARRGVFPLAPEASEEKYRAPKLASERPRRLGKPLSHDYPWLNSLILRISRDPEARLSTIADDPVLTIQKARRAGWGRWPSIFQQRKFGSRAALGWRVCSLPRQPLATWSNANAAMRQYVTFTSPGFASSHICHRERPR